MANDSLGIEGCVDGGCGRNDGLGTGGHWPRNRGRLQHWSGCGRWHRGALCGQFRMADEEWQRNQLGLRHWLQ